MSIRGRVRFGVQREALRLCATIARALDPIPGDPEREAHAQRSQHGVPLVMAVVEHYRDIAPRAGISLD